MLNKEKYKEDIMQVVLDGEIIAFDLTKSAVTACSETDCHYCLFKDECRINESHAIAARREWLNSEYDKPEIDWNKVPIDTPILVKNYNNKAWEKRHFCKYEDDTIYAWDYGMTSWSANDYDDVSGWTYATISSSVIHNLNLDFVLTPLKKDSL